MNERSLAFDSWAALTRAHAHLTDVFSRDEVWSEASMHEYDVLHTLAQARSAARLTELNREVSLSQPGLSRLVDRLVSRGLVTRRTDPADRRGVLLSLTDAGVAVDRRIADRHRHSVAATMYAALDSDELAQLTSLCEKLCAHTGEIDVPLSDEMRGEISAYAARSKLGTQSHN